MLQRNEGEAETTGAQSIGRAAQLLRLVAGHGATGAGLSQLVAASGLSKPTCRRILVALIGAGLAEQDPESRRYFLGPETFVLGTLAADRFGIHRLAAEGVARLAVETGDAAFLQVRRDGFVVCLQREDGPFPIRSHVLSAGDRHPLGVGAGGIALLAARTEAEVVDILDANAAILAGRYPMLSRALILDLVAEARAKGYSFNRGLLFPGSWGIGMVVRDGRGQPDGCLSLAAVESRMQPDREPVLVGLLGAEVRRLEARLGTFALENDTKTTTAPVAASTARRANERR